MDTHELMMLTALLGKLSQQDLSNFKRYSMGQWSRRNLEALLEDVKSKATN